MSDLGGDSEDRFMKRRIQRECLTWVEILRQVYEATYPEGVSDLDGDSEDRFMKRRIQRECLTWVEILKTGL